MEQKLLRLLDPRGLDPGNDQLDISSTLGEAPPLAKERNRMHPLPACLLESRKDIPGLAARGEHDENVARLAKGRYLTREDLGEVIVVPDRCHQTGINREGHGRIGAAVFLEAAGELGRQMSAVAGAPAIAAEHQLVTGQQGIAGHGGSLFQIGLQGGQRLKDFLKGLEGILELAHIGDIGGEGENRQERHRDQPPAQPRWIDSVQANRFDRCFMGFLREELQDLGRHTLHYGLRQLSLLVLLPLLSLLALGGCATQEPPQVKLDQANVLPLAINSAFTFRKEAQFLNDPALFQKGGTKPNESIEFERRYYMWPATTSLDKDELKGNYFNFFWWNHGSPADVTIRLEYRQANLGNFVMAREKSYTNVKGSLGTRFSIIGDDYLENGQVTNWRCILIVDNKIVALTQSYLWK